MGDIRDETSASETPTSETHGPRSAGSASGVPPETGSHPVGPESETHSGPEAPDTTLDATRRQQRNGPRQDPSAPFMPPDGIPGMRADLPPGSLPGPYLAAQGDENRTPPANAPSAVAQAITVAAPAGDRDPA
jgi:hypothetical protein